MVSKMSEDNIFVSGLIFKEDDTWTALCLDFDITGSGNTPEEAIRQNLEAIALYLETCQKEGKEIASCYRPVPKRYWLLYNWLVIQDTLRRRFPKQPRYFRQSLHAA